MPFHANPVFVMTRSINLTPGEVLMKGAAVFLVRVVLLTIALFVTFVGVLATSSRCGPQKPRPTSKSTRYGEPA
jgi:hypothetical protein